MQEDIHSKDLLTNFEPTIIRASTGKRLANYLIDLVVFYVVSTGLAILLLITTPNIVGTHDASDDLSVNFLDRLISLLFYGV